MQLWFEKTKIMKNEDKVMQPKVMQDEDYEN